MSNRFDSQRFAEMMKDVKLKLDVGPIHVHIHDAAADQSAVLRKVLKSLSAITNTLLTTAGKPAIPFDEKGVNNMTPQEILDKMTTDVAALTTAAASNKAVVEGLRAALAQAIADAKANGLTDAQIAGFTKLESDIEAATGDIVAASVENTPADPNNP